jgi:ABC-type antimicrobial peptide transport system permease subunit
VDDEERGARPALTIYQPAGRWASPAACSCVRAGDPYALVPAVTRVIRETFRGPAVERAATLEDVRAEVLSPERLNAFVFSGFAGIALLIAVVGVAGVLAFSVSARTREFGIRLAVGSAPRQLLTRVLSEGVLIAAVGIAAGPRWASSSRAWRRDFSKTCNCQVRGQSLARRPSSSAPRSSPR